MSDALSVHYGNLLTLWFLCFDGSHISIGDLDSRDPRLLEPCLVALIRFVWLVGIECETKVRPETHLGGLVYLLHRGEVKVVVATYILLLSKLQLARQTTH